MIDPISSRGIIGTVSIKLRQIHKRPFSREAPKEHNPDRGLLPGGDLLRLEIQIAKRADKLWQMAGQGRGSDLMHWLQAENEVLGRYLGPKPLVEALAAADQ